MKVDDVMTRAVVTVREGTPFTEIVKTLLDKDVSAVPVVDDSGALVGIVSEEDLLAKEAYPHRKRAHLPRLVSALLVGEGPWLTKAEGSTASDVMSSDVRTIGSGASVHEAARIMMESQVKRLPVVDEGRLVGIVSRHDVLRVFARPNGQLGNSITRLLRRCAFVPPDYELSVTITDGLVTLGGRVLYESDIRIIEDLVAAVDGVVSIDNRLLYRFRDPKAWTLDKAATLPGD